MTPHPRRRLELRLGLVALAKSLLLIVAVPVAVVRLWIERPLPHLSWSFAIFGEMTLWLHLVLVLLGCLWFLAAASLVRDIASAFGHRLPSESNNWSARWAGAIAALLLMSSAASVTLAALARTSANEITLSRSPPHGPPHARDQPEDLTKTLIVGEGECLADVAARALGHGDLWPLLARANIGLLQADRTRFVDANLVRTGWCLRPPVSQGGDEVPMSAGTTASTTSTQPSSASSGGRDARAELGLIGLGVLSAAALVRRLRQLQRVNESLRSPGERRPPPSKTAGVAEALLSPLAEGTLLDWIDCANRLLSALSNLAMPTEVLLVRAGPEAIEFFFGESPPSPPPPFRATADGRWWVLPLEADLEECRARSVDAKRFAPSLLPIGDDGDAVYLLHLGAHRRLVLDGPVDDVGRALTGILDTLRVLPWAEELDVELLGIPAPPPSEQCYQFAESSPAAVQLLAATLPSGPPPAASLHRTPLVIASQAASVAAHAAIEAAGAVAGVICCAGEGTERLKVAGELGRLLPYGVELRISAPDVEQQKLVELLLSEASRSPTVVELGRCPSSRSVASEQLQQREAGVEVCLLRGEPLLSGAVRSPATRDAARVTELVSYLALHGSKAPTSAIADALFGRAQLLGTPRRLDVLLAAAHGVLGTTSDGRRLLALNTEGIVQLAPEVSSDWVRFHLATARARRASAAEATMLLRDALLLLDAPRFAETAHYDWLIAEGLLAELVSEVIDAAHHLATLAHASEDLALAAAAIQTGRSLEPSSEILARDLIAILSTAGDSLGAARVYRDLEAALGELGGNEPSAETRALFLRIAKD